MERLKKVGIMGGPRCKHGNYNNLSEGKPGRTAVPLAGEDFI